MTTEQAVLDGSAVTGDGAVDIPAACEFTSLPRTTLYALMSSGQLQFIRIGRRRLIPRKALQALLERNLVPAGEGGEGVSAK
jgi:excisionase family DNA binding protein